jgi:adenine-specific DNA-methyltransferase
MQTAREKFQELLKKLFQFDCAELDFGIYRIMNHKHEVIEKFIEKDLLDGVEKELASGALAHESGLAQQLTELAAQIKENIADDAIDAEGNLNEKHNDTKLGKQYLELRAKAAQAKSRPELEALIFNHLYSFFSRYYDEGDFMALRRYSKRDKYAIPYNGEEVYLHWANSDQYYIKTAETFTDYSYKHNDWIVKFILRNAEVEQNNKKGAKRFFIPQMKDAVLTASKKTLTVPFEYRALTEQEEITYKSKPQETILAEASAKLFEFSKVNVEALSALATEKRKDTDGNPVSLIEHHLRAYTRKNTSDFFIHKDLKGFLERELDFYLKNEVLNLDELEAGGEQRTDSWFQIMHTMKVIGRKIIAFVAQIENFQKRIFEKKKFVIEVSYCITLDRIPEEFYPDIIKNKDHIEECKRLFHIQEIEQDTTQPGYTEPLKVAFLKAHGNLVLDTKFFSLDFKDKLLSKLPSIDAKCDGLLICSENFQALNLIRRRFYETVDMIYADPPYNTSDFGFVYKNTYKHSSWLAMVWDRIRLGYGLLPEGGIMGMAIDDTETSPLRFLLDRAFGIDNYIATIAAEVNPAGQNIRPNVPARSHDYCIFYAKNATKADLLVRELTEEEKAAYKEKDSKGFFLWDNLRRRGGNSRPSDRPNQWFPLYVNLSKKKVSVDPFPGAKEVWPIDPQGEKRIWRVSPDGARREIASGEISVMEKAGRIEVVKKSRMPKGKKPKTLWDESIYSGTTYGTKLLNDILGENKFSYPKSVYLVQDCIRYWAPTDAIIVDFFGGSGTTAHAILNLNSEDEGERKYILVEMGEYFEGVMKARIEKIIYAKEWKNGKPKDRHTGISHCFKCIYLESYEDAIDNISFRERESQLALQLEDYVLSYMLDFETRESDTLLNIAQLDSPFDYKLRLYDKDDPLPVDLPETFNYLIGLYVDSRKVYDNNGVRYLVYRGKVEGRETAVIWRTIRSWSEEELKADKEFVLKHKLHEGAEDIFVNGDSFIPGARSLDPIFKQRMFAEE